ncbi:MAG: DMT family transporter [Bdellovibrionota bacterium]
MRSKLFGPLFIGIAAVLWATDALFRFPTASEISPTAIVFSEHLIGVLFLFPLVFLTARKELMKFSTAEWMVLSLIGVGGSGFATILFTASFKLINPTVSILLQKLQPVLVVIIAYLFLGERPQKKFFLWAAVALGSAFVLSFREFNLGAIRSDISLRHRGVIFALSSSALWAVAIVAGKYVLKRHSPRVVTFWRYFFGLWGVFVWIQIAGISVPWRHLTTPRISESLIYMSLFPGVAAMLAYYAGLARTRASTAAFVELIFPVSAVLLNWKFLGAPLGWAQILASGVLLYSVTQISIKSE